MPEAEQLLAVAHLMRPHGVRGEISAIPLAPPVLDGALLIRGRLWARHPGGRVEAVEAVGMRSHQDRWLIALAGVETMDQAETWRDVDLCLPREELPDLPDGWFWEADLQACRVIDAVLGPIGAVDGLDLGGAQPRLRLRRPDGRIALIPWVRAFILRVDTPTHTIHTKLPADFPGITASARRE
ncbi:MAG: ribosome maturation factor RimM [bacterium]|nr:ribosome maturation factor RimM [bacterium]